MTMDKTIPTTPLTARAPTAPASNESSTSTYLQRARGFAQIAREAHNNCQRGQEAVEELRRRANRPGQ